MSELFHGESPARRSAVTLTGCLLVLTLLFEIALPMTYCVMMSLLIFIGPGGLTPPWWIAIGTHITAGTLLFVSFWGVGFCFFGVILRRSFVRWFLIALSILGISVWPFVVYEEVDSPTLLSISQFLAGWSVLLLITTLAAFFYMDSRMRHVLKK